MDFIENKTNPQEKYALVNCGSQRITQDIIRIDIVVQQKICIVQVPLCIWSELHIKNEQKRPILCLFLHIAHL